MDSLTNTCTWISQKPKISVRSPRKSENRASFGDAERIYGHEKYGIFFGGKIKPMDFWIHPDLACTSEPSPISSLSVASKARSEVSLKQQL
jgi:hypothetical protein